MNKKTFILYTEYYDTIKLLDDSQQAELFRAIFHYNIHDEIPELTPLVNGVFLMIKAKLDKDSKGYEDKIKENSKNGKIGNLKRWHPDLYDQIDKGKISLEEAEKLALDRVASPPDQPDRPPIAPDRPHRDRSQPIATDRNRSRYSDDYDYYDDYYVDDKLEGGDKKSPPRSKKELTFQNIQLADISDWLQTKGFEFDLDQELENFKHHYATTGGKMSNGRVVKDWRAALQKWLNRSQTFRDQSLTKPRGNNAKLTGANANNGSAGISGLSIDEQTEELKRQIRSGQLNPSVV